MRCLQSRDRPLNAHFLQEKTTCQQFIAATRRCTVICFRTGYSKHELTGLSFFSSKTYWEHFTTRFSEREVRREKVSHKRNEIGIPPGSLIYRFVYFVPHICVDSFLFHATVIRVSEKLKGLLTPERTYVSTAALKPLEKKQNNFRSGSD